MKSFYTEFVELIEDSAPEFVDAYYAFSVTTGFGGL